MAIACTAPPPCARAATSAAMTTAPSIGSPKRERRPTGGPHARAGEGDSVTQHASTRVLKGALLQGFLAARIWVITRALPVAYPPNSATQRPAKQRGVSRGRNRRLAAERAQSHDASEWVRAGSRGGAALGSGRGARVGGGRCDGAGHELRATRGSATQEACGGPTHPLSIPDARTP